MTEKTIVEDMKILVIENDENVALKISEEFEFHGYESITINTRDDLFEKIKTDNKYLLIFGENSFLKLEEIHKIRTIETKIPFVYIIDEVNVRKAVNIIHLGAMDCWVRTERIIEELPELIKYLVENYLVKEEFISYFHKLGKFLVDKYKLVVDKANQGIMVIQSDKIVFYNKKILQVTGYTEEEFSTLSIFDLVHPLDRTLVYETRQKRLKHGNADEEYDIRFLNKYGEMYWVNIHPVIIKWNDEEAILIYLSEVTEKKLMEEKLRQNEKMEAVELLASGIANDFNNLLVGILGAANLLKFDLEPGTDVYEAADTIEKSSERASELTQQLLKFARKTSQKNENVNIHEMLEEIISMMKRSFREINFNYEPDAFIHEISLDSEQISKTLMNIITNACEAMNFSGEVTINTDIIIIDEICSRSIPDSSPGEFFQITIIDKGCGIPEEIIDRIFEPFFTTKDKDYGRGMGLAIAYGVIKKHGGYIDITSDREEGTTVKICLPVIISRIYTIEEIEQMKLNILVVDDDKLVLSATSAMLKKIGYNVITATRGNEAVNYYRENFKNIDLAIIDINMPGMNGIECFRELKKINGDIKAIITTGFTKNSLCQKLIDENEIQFIGKPFLSKTLVETIEKVFNS